MTKLVERATDDTGDAYDVPRPRNNEAGNTKYMTRNPYLVRVLARS